MRMLMVDWEYFDWSYQLWYWWNVIWYEFLWNLPFPFMIVIHISRQWSKSWNSSLSLPWTNVFCFIQLACLSTFFCFMSCPLDGVDSKVKHEVFSFFNLLHYLSGFASIPKTSQIVYIHYHSSLRCAIAKIFDTINGFSFCTRALHTT